NMMLKTIAALAFSACIINAYASPQIAVRADVKTQDMKVKLQDDGRFKIHSWHEIYINNTTDHVLRFRHVYSLCAERKGCKTNDSYFDVSPHTEKRINYTMERRIDYDHTGRYEYSAKTDVYGIVNDS